MAIFAAVSMRLTRGTTLFVDEANLFTADRGLHPDALLAPLNGHLVLGVRLIYAVSFRLFGADFVVPRLVEVLGALLVAGLLFTLLKRRIGALAALAPTVLLLFLGSAWEANFIVSGLTNVYSLALGLGALLALERGQCRDDVAACALLTAAVATWSLGIAFAVGAGVWILLRPDRPRRLWVFLVPLGFYAAWLIWLRSVYGPEHGGVASTLKLGNLLVTPNFVAEEAAAVAGAVAGLNYFGTDDGVFAAFATKSAYGPVLAAAAVAALVWRLRRGAASPMLWASIAILVTFWAALGLSYSKDSGRTPETVRFVYPSAAAAFLVAAEAMRGWRPSPRALLILFMVTGLALTTNLARLRDAGRFYRSFATSLRAQLTAIELARDRVSPAFVPAGSAQFDHLLAGPYLAAVDRNGSPAFSPAELARQPDASRQAADAALVSALRIGLVPGTTTVPARDCRRVPSVGPSQSFAARPPGITLASPAAARVALRRFATSSRPVGVLPPRKPVVLALPRDRSSRPWYVTVSSTGKPTTVCDLVRPAR